MCVCGGGGHVLEVGVGEKEGVPFRSLGTRPIACLAQWLPAPGVE